MPAAELPPLPFDPEYCVVCRRNDSLATGQRWTVFGTLAAVSLTLAAGFAAMGAWLVLPYSLLEISVLAWAFRYMERRAADWERLTVSGDRVLVERCAEGRHSQREWNRCWVQVQWMDGAAGAGGAGRWAGPRLALRSAGESWEFGSALPAGERQALARSLRRLLALRQ
jgi:uncharacterized membrane protein